MKVLGIIAEYNPFHNGHLYHIKKSIEIVKPDYIVVVMSGHFTQRGEISVVDKWLRTEMAIKSGIDLVIELPTFYAVQTAELFAYGSVQLLNHTGLITHISFGSEVGEIGPLKLIADILLHEPEEYKDFLKKHLNDGHSFPHARINALKEYLTTNDEVVSSCFNWKKTLESSNSILAIEYLKALKKTNSKIEPVTLTRINSSYNSLKLKKGISSATSIRNEIYKSGISSKLAASVPKHSLDLLTQAFEAGKCPYDSTALEQLILGHMRRVSKDEIRTWMDVEEGLENRIKEYAYKSRTLDEFLDGIKTKRYVYTRMQRILIHGLLGITQDKTRFYNNEGGPQYIRILGFSKRALPLLAKLKKTSTVPIISKASNYYKLKNDNINSMFEIDVLATNLYTLAFRNSIYRTGNVDFTEKIVII